MFRLGFTRGANRHDHLLHTPDTFVTAALPGMKQATAIVHIAPAVGAQFMEYTAIFETGGTLGVSTTPRFLYVTDGQVSVDGTILGKSGYTYQPAHSQARIEAASAARAIVIEKPYEPIEGFDAPAALIGHENSIQGKPLDGDDANVVLRPDSPSFTVASGGSAHFAVPAYLGFGVEHILSGPDHLLFVLGLLLLVRNRWMLFRTVSAFTVAHSITLTATVLGALRVPVPFVEALIALSILFLALEVLRAQRGGSSVAIRHPWAAAFAFGLFHGMGFASGLAALGLGQHDLLATLALFNIGVEIGQLCFIAVALLLGYGLQRLHIGRWPQAAAIPSYIIGIAGAYWTFQSGAAWLGA